MLSIITFGRLYICDMCDCVCRAPPSACILLFWLSPNESGQCGCVFPRKMRARSWGLEWIKQSDWMPFRPEKIRDSNIAAKKRKHSPCEVKQQAEKGPYLSVVFRSHNKQMLLTPALTSNFLQNHSKSETAHACNESCINHLLRPLAMNLSINPRMSVFTYQCIDDVKMQKHILILPRLMLK